MYLTFDCGGLFVESSPSSLDNSTGRGVANLLIAIKKPMDIANITTSGESHTTADVRSIWLSLTKPTCRKIFSNSSSFCKDKIVI